MLRKLKSVEPPPHDAVARPNTKVVRVPVNKLRIHPTAQRDITTGKIKAMMANFDLDAIGVLHAVQYDVPGPGNGWGIWIIDGQHRVDILQRLEFGEWEVDVMIHLDVKDDARASQLFLELGERSVIHPWHKFDNAVRAGIQDAVGSFVLADRFGFKVHKNAGDGHIVCVKALTDAWNLDEGISLEKTLRVIAESWGTDKAGTDGFLISGLSNLFYRFGHLIDSPALIKKLAKYEGGPSKLLGAAKGIRSIRKVTVARCVTIHVADLYNAGRRLNLIGPL